MRQAPAKASAQPASGRGRLVFALDATMSRQPTWDLAQQVQGQMFAVAAACGGLDIQLVYFRGLNECRASGFMRDGAGLGRAMSKISVMSGQTQIGRVLRHIRTERGEAPLGAFVYVGDSMEEKADDLGRIAGELGLLGVKGFFFHEGGDTKAAAVFKDLARLSGGAYAVFDSRAPGRLAALLRAAAAYAAGGYQALRDRANAGEAEARQLLSQMR
ncbi:VWA domain-containing protein [Rhodoblastus acidophilus]|uniref:VWA domain-containing protein n=2 Tax=Candidatus Rhodoblastus alkanivorans TaxID=2954117 RepID=A0ABS9Z647_9HYPH|nr:VWA domain-containing protein [Candidatus Rhodoblastus alkanivorans]MCI4680285.1 VWA domain-containing protein [Candidatus Rhodoblastus alkanivorans]MCI4683104.1 VWA domain-containing protein [Candidatus Rhodoblastus alkanivorans]MDI4640415.1 VWA domain-containing protein [Rhodoblastus acidophilus]